MKIWECKKCARKHRTKANVICVSCPECLEAMECIFDKEEVIMLNKKRLVYERGIL